MDKELLLSAEVQEFIQKHESDDLNALLLQRDKYPQLPISFIVDQIKGRKKAKAKLPTWYNTKAIIYPQPVSIEQSSSEITADWKANYIGSGELGIDLTGGFGVDSFAFASQFKNWCHVEPNKELQEIVKHNATLFEKTNFSFQNSDAEQYINELHNQVDFIYIDPDRRPGKQRVVGFEESTPDISKLLDKLYELSERVLIKASPMIDIQTGLNGLSYVSEVVVLAVDNEVKEVLFQLRRHYTSIPIIRCVNILKGVEYSFIYEYNDTSQEGLKISELDAYLYEPNASIMKAGGQNVLAIKNGLARLHRNTNLFTSTRLVEDYPGRIFKVIGKERYNRKAIAPLLNDQRANISTRNFVDTPEQMKKKLGIRDGGDIYLFGYRDLHNKNIIAVCKKVI